MTTQHKRFYDSKYQCFCVSVLPGDFYVTNIQDEMITTILGSCIAACIRNTKTGYGGLNHFLLAEPGESITSPSNRYGSYAMEQLINSILQHGGTRSDLEVKIFGGSELFNISHPIGITNIKFIRKYLLNEGMKIAAEDVGGTIPRKIFYWPSTGQVSRLLITPRENQIVIKQEESFKNKLSLNSIPLNAQTSHAGSIELF